MSHNALDEVFTILSAAIDPTKGPFATAHIAEHIRSVDAGHGEMGALWPVRLTSQGRTGRRIDRHRDRRSRSRPGKKEELCVIKAARKRSSKKRGNERKGEGKVVMHSQERTALFFVDIDNQKARDAQSLLGRDLVASPLREGSLLE
jgi:hypothetical protein